MTLGAFIDKHGVGRWAVNFILILGVFAALLVWGRHTARRDTRTRYDFCVELEQVRTYARDAAQRGLKTVPTLSYYKHHPKERVQAIRDIQRQVDFFSPPLNCKRFANS